MTPSHWLCLSYLLLLLVNARVPWLEGASVTGRIAAGLGNPIPGARVTLFNEGLATFREARTDVVGNYTLGDVPPGSYSLGASAIDFEYREEPIVPGASETARNFVLGEEQNPGR